MFAVIRTGGKQWMIHRMDPPEDPRRPPLGEHPFSDRFYFLNRIKRLGVVLLDDADHVGEILSFNDRKDHLHRAGPTFAIDARDARRDADVPQMHIPESLNTDLRNGEVGTFDNRGIYMTPLEATPCGV